VFFSPQSTHAIPDALLLCLPNSIPAVHDKDLPMKMRAITSSSSLKRTLLAHAAVALLAASAFTIAPQAQARVFISVNLAPPLLPVYEQPPLPGPGYLWTPGYWAYADGGYYWVPGTWVRAPYRGALWTPGYWGWGGGGAYVFHGGYWGLHVGYYGGINYGFGYTGSGYYGGYWNRGGFYYNQAVNRFGGVRVTNVYNRTVINNTTVNRYSFNGPGGINRAPTRQELAVARERHMGPTGEQVKQRELASRNETLRASVNHGTPPIPATQRAGEFTPKGANHGAAVSAEAHLARSQHDGGIGKDVSAVARDKSALKTHTVAEKSTHGTSTKRESSKTRSTEHGHAAKTNERSNRGMREPSPRASAQGQRSEDKHETARHSDGPRQDRGDKRGDRKHGN